MKNRLFGRDPDAGKNQKQRGKREAEDEMLREHHWLSGHEFEQTPGNSGGHRSLACSSPWRRRVRHNLANAQQQCPKTTLFFFFPKLHSWSSHLQLLPNGFQLHLMPSWFYVTPPSTAEWSISGFLPQSKSICKSVAWTSIKTLLTRSSGDTLNSSESLSGGIIKVIGTLVEGPKVDMTSYPVDRLFRVMTAPAGD